MVSNMGKIDTRMFEGGGFNCRDITFAPQGPVIFPFFLVLSGNSDGLDITLSIAKNLADNGRIEKALDRMILGIQEHHHSVRSS